MAKRKHIRTAGRLMTGVVYTAAKVPRSDGRRERKRAVTDAARQLMNTRYSYQKLELQLAGNFQPKDWFLTLTYDDAHLPPTRAEAVRSFRRFVGRLRGHRKKLEEAFDYIYVTEGQHGDHRLHHHMVVNCCEGDFETIQGFWDGGHCHFKQIDDVGYEQLAEYMTKEAKEAGKGYVGERMWSSSKGLRKPVSDKGFVEDGFQPEIPKGSKMLETMPFQNEFGSFLYFKCMLPETNL